MPRGGTASRRSPFLPKRCVWSQPEPCSCKTQDERRSRGGRGSSPQGGRLAVAFGAEGQVSRRCPGWGWLGGGGRAWGRPARPLWHRGHRSCPLGCSKGQGLDAQSGAGCSAWVDFPRRVAQGARRHLNSAPRRNTPGTRPHGGEPCPKAAGDPNVGAVLPPARGGRAGGIPAPRGFGMRSRCRQHFGAELPLAGEQGKPPLSLCVLSGRPHHRGLKSAFFPGGERSEYNGERYLLFCVTCVLKGIK